MDYYLDTKGFECPIPVLKAEKFIKKLKKNPKTLRQFIRDYSTKLKKYK